MNWIEQIVLRSSCNTLKELDLNGFFALVNQDQISRPNRINVYRHGHLETDICILLFWETERSRTAASSVAQYLSRYLKDYGLVTHSWWIEVVGDDSSVGGLHQKTAGNGIRQHTE
ncbi:hypothetical protein KKI24_08985 [bacterium]|nr:hypothetical protein [bacterium]